MDFRGVFIAPLRCAFELFQTSFIGQGNIWENLRGACRDIEAGMMASAQERLRNAMQFDQGDLAMSVGTVARPGSDEELQELRKFFKLASECNPNIIEFLYIDRLITLETDVWRRIRAKRDLFLSKRARYTFGCYAVAQLNRIKTHRGYLLNPLEKRPLRADYGLPEKTTLAAEYQNAILSLPDDYVSEGAKDVVKREREYHKKMDEWRAYQEWKANRNPKRQEIEAKYHYDAKHATHLVRLIRMAQEILSEGVVRVYRPDREELMAIRNGSWPYEKLVEFAEGMDAQLDELSKKSSLRDRPDHKGISELYKEICEEHYGIKLRG